MVTNSSAEVLQYIAWLTSLIGFILAFYILALNAWHTANRHVGGLLLLIAVNMLAVGLLLAADSTASLVLPTVLMAATSPMMEPALVLVALVLVKPEWLQSRGRRWPSILALLLYALILAPPLLTAIDLAFGTGLWYTGVADSQAGYLPLTEYAAGHLSAVLRGTNIYGLGVLGVLPLAYVAFIDRTASQGPASYRRRLSVVLLVAHLMAIGAQVVLQDLLVQPTASLLATAGYIAAYAYAVFQQMVSARQAQRGRLHPRLTALVLAITVPLLVAVAVLLSTRAGQELERSANEQLEANNRTLAANLDVWLDLNLQSLQNLAMLADIVSMEPERQKPLLEAMAAAHPHMYLVSTTDMTGMNVARNDDEAPKDYHDRLWHIGARNGVPVTYQTLIGRTSGEPALVISVPIRRNLGTIAGVAMFASDLDDIGQEVRATKVGQTGYAYVVDGLNQVVAHPIPEYAAEFLDLDYYPPVFEMRAGHEGLLTFVDEEGVAWRASVTELDNGWGVIVQQQEEELLASVRGMRQVAWGVVAVGLVLLAGLMFLAVRQIIQPVRVLTDTATAIASGDLERVALVESEDEVGTLAQAFNSMTRQLRELISGLEQQVTERTQELEQRSAYLEATAEVGRAAASILDRQQLVRQVVELIRERFDLYYVGLFLSDETNDWAVLEAGTGEAGKMMLARGHKIRIGEGMVGWSVAHGEWRVAGEAAVDTVRLATPELPLTRSEAALPLLSRGRTLGALTVQHTQPGAFDPDTMAVLQTMADQVAVALDNATLFAESEQALIALRQAYGEVSRRSWTELVQARREWGYRYAQRQVMPIEAQAAGQQTSSRVEDAPGENGRSLTIPLKVRDQPIGVLGFRKRAGEGDWTPEETELLEALTGQLEVALESARLYQDTQRSAERDRLLAEVVGRVRETLDVESVLRTLASEVRQALDLPEVVVRLGGDTRAAIDSEVADDD